MINFPFLVETCSSNNGEEGSNNSSCDSKILTKQNFNKTIKMNGYLIGKMTFKYRTECIECRYSYEGIIKIIRFKKMNNKWKAVSLFFYFD